MPTDNFASIPNELKELKQWVLWRKEILENGKSTKIPYSTFGNPASVTNSSDWTTFDNAIYCFYQGNYSGIGFVFTEFDQYSGIDLDDAEGDAVIYERQLKVFKEFNSYSELSPSGKGLHIIVKGKVPFGIRKSKIEIYPSKRYFTMTGNVYQNGIITENHDLLNQLWEQMGGKENKSPIIIETGEQIQFDEQILELAFKHNADKFIPLSNADMSGYVSQSEADQAYMNIIAYYTNSKEQVIRIYSKSKLAQTDDKRKKKYYLNKTVDKAFDQKIPRIDIGSYKANIDSQLQLPLAVSDNSNPAAFDAVNVGAIPSTASNTNNASVAQLVEPTPHKSLGAGSSPAASTISIEPPPGLVGDIARFIYHAAPRPVGEVAIAAAIGLMAGICGRAYNISGTGLNQYIMLIAMTGAGKEAMASGIDKIINAVQLSVPVAPEFIGPSRIASGQALYKYLSNKSQSFVSIIGEFGKRLEAMSSRSANSAEKQLIAELLDLYNKSGFGQTAKPSIYSDQDKNTITIMSPAFSILGESTPDTFYSSLNEDMISDGLLPRFMLIEYNGPRPELNENHVNVQPDFSLIDNISTLMANAKTVMSNRKVINVGRSDEAAKILQDFDKLADSRINTTDKETIRQLWNRAHIKVLKISALLAVGQHMHDPIINVNDVMWAKRIVENDIRALSIKFEEGTVGKSSEEIKQANEVKRMIKEFLQPANWDKISKYCLDQRLYSNGVIPYHYLNKRLSPIAVFQQDRLGATTSLKRTIQILTDSGLIAELPKQQMIEVYGSGQKAYVVVNIKSLIS